ADRADSLVINPHKWLFVPVDCSVLFTRHPDLVRGAFSLVPEYLRTPPAAGQRNLMDYGPALGRRFRALKLWMVLRYFGAEGIAARLREHVRLARWLAAALEARPGWELTAPASMAVVCFRHRPAGVADETDLAAHNQALMDHVNRSGAAFISHTVLAGRFSLRVAVGHIRTTQQDVAILLAALEAAATDEAVVA
ncbi:MAG TPA: pyridoxal-dependent decarboxylase, partial [Candidatus Dormibacteraeota bacterium]|nr:pyridoxal-dependent decarboxylase [Candidatus Dormibacteraeota bacterium]